MRLARIRPKEEPNIGIFRTINSNSREMSLNGVWEIYKISANNAVEISEQSVKTWEIRTVTAVKLTEKIEEKAYFPPRLFHRQF
jgi:hypothetical protein